MYSNAPKKPKYANFYKSTGYWPQRTAVHDHASHPLWDVIRKSRAGYRGEAATRAKRAHRPARGNLKYGYPKIFRLTCPHFNNSACLPFGLLDRHPFTDFQQEEPNFYSFP